MSDATRIGLISDTHGLLRNEVYAAFEGVEEIIHAGDVGDPWILTELEVIAPVHAVYGNVDGWDIREVAPEEVELERIGHKLAVIHGHQWGSPRVEDLVERYTDFSTVVYGHTHQPLIREVDGVLLVNPGSAGHRRFGRPATVAVLSLEPAHRPRARLVELVS